MNSKYILVGLLMFLFMFIAFFFYKNINTIESKKDDCIMKAGYCIDLNKGCQSEQMIPYPDAVCYTKINEKNTNKVKIEIDNSKVCCIKYSN